MPHLFQRLLLRNFSLIYRASVWTRRRFTPEGRFLLGLLVFSGALGIDTRINIVHQIFALCLAALAVALLWSPWFRSPLLARRYLPRYATVKQPMRYEIEVENPSSRHERGLWLIDELAISPPTLETFFGLKEPGEKQRNWFDRKVGYPRWAWLMGQRAGALEPEGALDLLPARDRRRLRLELIPLRRGWLHFSRLHLGRADPLGLFRASRILPLGDRLLVLPPRYPIPAITLPGTHCYQAGGVALAGQIGESEECIGVRDYRPGDPLRKIHWKGFAKTGSPLVREYRDEFMVRHGLVLDTFTRHEGVAFEAAVAVAASFVARIDTRESLLDLVFVGRELHRITTGRRLGGNEILLAALACVNPCGERDFSEMSRAVMERASQLSGCICVLLQWDEARQGLVRSLERMGIATLVLIVSAAYRQSPPPPGPLAAHPERLRVIDPEHVERDLCR